MHGAYDTGPRAETASRTIRLISGARNGNAAGPNFIFLTVITYLCFWNLLM